MSYGDHRLYLYGQHGGFDCYPVQFMWIIDPMNNRKLKVHKGLSNEVFLLTNRDRKS